MCNLLTLARTAILLAGCCFVAAPVRAQTAAKPAGSHPLQDLNAAIQTLTAKVSPSVVQVIVTGYRQVDDAPQGATGVVIGRRHIVGSGAIIDSQGYIVTNAHVVAGAQQVRVAIQAAASASGPLQSLAAEYARTVPATIIGVAADLDLALLKVDVPGLKALPFANYDQVRQGQLVFAFGNPEGLRNSVSMGVISSAARQLDQDSPHVYVQTDAPINPGNSGGPLVNVDGEIVGMNTFIFTESGGSQGLGFAIPSAVIAAAYPQLRQYGHVHRAVVGLSAQAITPALAENLALPISAGVVIADVEPDSPAAAAGVAIGDILTSVNGRLVDSIPRLTLALDTLHAGDTVTLGLVRGEQTLSLAIVVIEAPHPIDQLIDLGDPDKNAVPKLGIVGVNVDAVPQPLVEGLRIPSGVLVTARRQDAGVESPLVMGDIIHAVNAVSVRSLDGLQVLMNAVKSSDDVVLQVERDHHLMFVTMTIY